MESVAALMDGLLRADLTGGVGGELVLIPGASSAGWAIRLPAPPIGCACARLRDGEIHPRVLRTGPSRRVPACPGQYDARDDWPVLNAEVTPDLDTATWTFTVHGLVRTRRPGRGTRSTPCPSRPTTATSTA